MTVHGSASVGTAGSGILQGGDPPPVTVVRPGGRAELLFVGDHAGNAVPAALAGLGLTLADRERHIAWDIGVRALGERLAALLDATFVHQHFSRLVIDCNRHPEAASSVVDVSDQTRVPGNIGLDVAAREARRLAIHAPYHQRIADEIAVRRRAGAGPMVVALHSFTPIMGPERRPWQIGVLHHEGDTRASQAMLTRIRQEGDVRVGDNEPYQMDGTDYTVPYHTYPDSLPYLELEFRNDLLAERGADHWAVRAAGWIADVLARIQNG